MDSMISAPSSVPQNPCFDLKAVDGIGEPPEYFAEFLRSKPTKFWVVFKEPEVEGPAFEVRQDVFFGIEVDPPVTSGSQTFASCHLMMSRPTDLEESTFSQTVASCHLMMSRPTDLEVDPPVTSGSQTFASCHLTMSRPTELGESTFYIDGKFLIILRDKRYNDPFNQVTYNFSTAAGSEYNLTLRDWIQMLRGRPGFPHPEWFNGDLLSFSFIRTELEALLGVRDWVIQCFIRLAAYRLINWKSNGFFVDGSPSNPFVDWQFHNIICRRYQRIGPGMADSERDPVRRGHFNDPQVRQNTTFPPYYFPVNDFFLPYTSLN